MHLDFSNRIARLSVGEWARFSLGPGPSRDQPTGRWRMEVGSQWHRTLQERTTALAAKTPGHEAQFEISIAGNFRLGNWTVQITGRLDQVLHSPAGIVFREVKTVRDQLPRPEDEMVRDYPSYAAQLAIYLGLAALVDPWRDQAVSGELLFVEIDEGISQTIPIDAKWSAQLLQERKTVLGAFLHAREIAATRRAELTFQPTFPSLRPGQEETRARLEHLATRHQTICFEAPTGYGKTGTMLEYALTRLREGLFDRVLYLTSKSTGQLQVAKQLEEMLGDAPGIRFLQMRNRGEHTIPELPHDFFDRRAQPERWREAQLDPAVLWTGATLPLDAIKRIGKTHGIEPYSITRALLPHAEFWLGDYNYVFAPRNRQVFEETPGFAADRTLLIIDEAHNLPDRVADALSGALDAADAHLVAAQLQIRGWPDRAVRLVGNLAGFLDSLRPSEALDTATVYEGQGFLRDTVEHLFGMPLAWEDIDAFALEWLWQLPAFLAAVERPGLDYLSWAPGRGKWAQTCLDAAPEIAPILRQFGQTVLLSATLQPLDALLPRLGFTTAATAAPGFLEALAPWREGAYEVAVDTRVDTRYQARDRSIPQTATTILGATLDADAAVVVFFSSYAYAQKVAEVLAVQDPFLRVAIAPRRSDLATQTRFIEESLLSAHAIFLVLGTGFSEGIDLLGGRVERAIVVGPALPEVNAVTRAGLAAREHKGRELAFREVYQIPGMVKVNQALGRLVRGPGQRAKVLLHGKRLAEASYQNLLAPDFRAATELRTAEAVSAWWRE